MADVLTVTLVILGLLVALPSFWLLLRALFPAPVESSRERIVDRPVLCFAAGLVPSAVLLFAGLLLLQKAPGGWKGLGLPLLLALFLLGGLGLAGLSAAVGGRLPSPGDEGRPWRGVVRGAVCLELAFLIPVLGWFGLLPLVSVAAVGAALLSLIAGSPSPSPSPSTPAA